MQRQDQLFVAQKHAQKVRILNRKRKLSPEVRYIYFLTHEFKIPSCCPELTSLPTDRFKHGLYSFFGSLNVKQLSNIHFNDLVLCPCDVFLYTFHISRVLFLFSVSSDEERTLLQSCFVASLQCFLFKDQEVRRHAPLLWFWIFCTLKKWIRVFRA